MDNRKHPKTVPIRKRQGESSRSNSNSDAEGTFIPVTDVVWSSVDFINTKFTEDEPYEEEEVKVIDLQSEERPPLFLLFPDLCNTDKEQLKASTSTTQVTKILKGKRADFRLLKPSKRLNPEQSKLPPLYETVDEYQNDEEASFTHVGAAASGGELVQN